jgi:hypothetical protein
MHCTCIARQCDLRSGPATIHHCCVAIQFARARYISRSTGGSAVRSAAYNERAAITADRTGELFYFKHRDAPEHHEVLLPEGCRLAVREQWGVVERSGGGGEAQGRAGRPRDRAGAAGECRTHRRGPHAQGTIKRPVASGLQVIPGPQTLQ